MPETLQIAGCTVREALRFGTARLALRDDLRENAAADAQQLLAIATGLTRVQMLASPDRPLLEEQAGAFQGMLAQRRGAVPIQHLRGTQDFFGRTFAVSPDVLIPRPETEHIVEEVLRLFPDREAHLRFADVGTGSGILAITLALEYARSTVLATDISAAALQQARDNARHWQVEDRIRLAEGDLLAPAGEERFHCIVSNPPYVPLRDAPSLHPQVRDHEPHVALFGGDDGHDVLRRLVPQAASHLLPGGWLLMETAGRSDLADALLADWAGAHWVRDLQGIQRVAASQAAF